MLSSIEWNRTHRGVPLKNKKNNQKIIKLLCHTVVKGINLFHSEVVVSEAAHVRGSRLQRAPLTGVRSRPRCRMCEAPTESPRDSDTVRMSSWEPVVPQATALMWMCGNENMTGLIALLDPFKAHTHTHTNAHLGRNYVKGQGRKLTWKCVRETVWNSSMSIYNRSCENIWLNTFSQF